MSKTSQVTAQAETTSTSITKPDRICGIVRPIADMGSYTAKHWREVHSVIAEAVETAGFTLRLVSESDAAGVILTEIVSNLYQDEIVIVDVSGRNPNVMFELGMRLAFEKPAIIVMDDETPFSFDISPVKHRRYPRTLRYTEILDFKSELAASVKATLELSPEKKNYLQQFGPVKVTELGDRSKNLDDLANDVQEIKRAVFSSLNTRTEFLSEEAFLDRYRRDRNHSSKIEEATTSVLDVEVPEKNHSNFINELKKYPIQISGKSSGNNVKIIIHSSSPEEHRNLRNIIRNIARDFRLQ